MRFILFFILCFFHLSIFAQIRQEKYLNIQNFTSKQGLPNNNINFTFQDKYGYIWIGTNTGLSKFNGYSFKNFLFNPNSNNSIKFGQFISYYQVSDSIYYLAANKDGLVKLNIINHTIQKVKNSPKGIVFIHKDQDGTYWLGAKTNGIFHFFPHNNKFEQTLLKPLVNEYYQDDDNNTVASIVRDKVNDSILWLSSGIGLFRFNKITQKLYQYRIRNASYYRELGLNKIFSIFIDDNGFIWTGTRNGGLCKFDIQNNSWQSYQFDLIDFSHEVVNSNFIKNILKLNDSILLLSTNIGAMEFNVFTKTFKLYKFTELENSSVNYIMFDNDKNFWFSHGDGRGLSLYNKRWNSIEKFNFPKQKYFPDQNPSSFIDGFYSEKYQSYFMSCSDYDGLLMINKDLNKPKSILLPTNESNLEPFGLYIGEDDKGLIWINDYFYDLFVFNPVSNKVNWYKNAPFKKCLQIYRGLKNKLYFNTERGVFCLQNNQFDLIIENKNCKNNDPENTCISFLSNEFKNYFIYQFDNALYKFECDSKKSTLVINLPKYAYEGNNHLWQIFIDSKERVWLTLEQGGIYYLDLKTNKLTLFTTFDGISENKINKIIEDKNGTIFINTSGKINFFDEIQKRFIDLDQIANNINYSWSVDFLLLTHNDNILTCQNDCYFLINKNDILEYSKSNPIITSIHGESFSYTNVSNNLLIPNYENNITFELSNFDYSRVNEIIYSYQLDNNNWVLIEKGKNKLFLSNLSEGKHQIKFKINGNSYILSYQFVINVIWYKSKWFYLAIVFLFLILLISVLWFYFNKNNKQKQLEKRVSELKLISLQSQLNPHFLFNCLTSISGLIKTKEYDKSEQILNDFAKLMRLILTNSSKDFITLDEEIKISKLYLDIEKVRKNESFEYSFFLNNESLLFKQIPPLILQPFLENCIKHGFELKSIENKGHINVEILELNQGYQILISDNGIGVKEITNTLQNHQSLGIEIQKERLMQYAKTHGLNINIHTEFAKNIGAKIKISIV